jgi:predicted transcriptional regulator
MSNLTLELDTNTMQKLTALAEASHQSVSQWIEQVVVSFEAMQETKALIADVQLAQQQLANGQGIEHDSVKASLLASFAV